MTKSVPPTKPSPTRDARSKGRQTNAPSSRRGLWIGLGVVALIAVLALLWTRTRSDTLTGVTMFPNLERGHQSGPMTYAQTPPVGGVHNPVWQNCGIYDEPLANENAVHSLEHGAVWVTYRPDLAATEVAQLRGLVRGRPYTLLSPYPGLPAPVVASAWGVQLSVEQATDARLQQFLQTYVQGPQTPEPGAPCIGGTGTPSSQ